MIRSIKAITTTAVAASVLAIAAPATAASAQPQTGQGCWPLAGTQQECTQVVGTGLQVTSISGKYTNGTGSTQIIYIEVYGPNGHITNTANQTVPNGGTTGWDTWHNPHPTANMTPGYYCTEAYHSNGTPIISDCIEVHT